MEKYTRMPTDTFQKLVLNAGILVDEFAPATGVIGNILGATTGGISFSTNPEFVDFGEDVDNCPNNTMELKKLSNIDPTMSGTFLTCTPAVIKSLIGSADIDTQDTTKVIPRSVLLTADFEDVWWVGDYSDVNTGSNAGFLAIHLKNALNTAGFQIQSTKNEKGQMAFEYHGHFSIEDLDDVPFEIYCKAGESSADPFVQLSTHVLRIAVGDPDVTLGVSVSPAGSTVTWNSSATGKATATGGVIHAVEAGSTIVTASITVDGVTYNDTCTVVVSGT